MSEPKPSTPAERLKAQGNAFHVAGKYKAAYTKYSEAIALDPKNPILWANRAASSLAMKEYLDAATDAKKAHELDPKYAKAWARHATAMQALGSYRGSIDCWKSALECIPTDKELSPEQQALKAQFTEGLDKAQEAENRPPAETICLPKDSIQVQNVPWKRAQAMEKELEREQRQSSAWVILHAYKEFNTGMETLRKIKRTVVGNQLQLGGMPGAIVDISNGILRDERVFHVNDMPDFFERYSDQIRIEIARAKAWDEGGPKLVQGEALKRLKTSGWDNVRPALTVTVRGWVLRAFIQDSAEGGTPEFFRQAIEVLEWGTLQWKDVPKDDRGAIFEPTFVRGVKKLYIKSLMGAYMKKGVECGYTLEEIFKYAQALIRETIANPPTGTSQIDFGFYASFWTYVTAEALAVMGWCSIQSAFESESDETSLNYFAEAALFYTKAAESFLKDDENYAYFLGIALEAHWWLKSPLSITLPLVKRIREALPAIRKIWEYSFSFHQRVEERLKQILAFEEECQKGISDGFLTLDSAVRPHAMEPEALRRHREKARARSG